MTQRRVAPALLALAVVLAGAACAHAPRAAAAKGDDATAAAARLDDVFARVLAARAAGRPALLVFGLDGTLLDPAARTREVFSLAFDGPDPVVHPPRPDLSTAIRALPLSDYESDPAATLAKIGVTDSAFVRAVLTRWNQDYFSNRFLSRDEPVPGAVSFLDSLHARGATIIYLSARDTRRMLAGTAQSLLERGFPVGDARSMLILKPDRTTPEVDALNAALDELAAYGNVVALFESDPGRIRQMHARFPGALAFRVGTKATPDTVAPGIKALKNFEELRVP